MPLSSDELLQLLDQLGLETQTHSHEAAFTVEQGNAVWGSIPGVHCKNLFLKDAKQKLWLVVCPGDRKIDLKSLPAKIGSARISFGSATLLVEVLGIQPGSVTPFALINDPEQRVNLVLDAEMMQADLINFHPLRNDRTTTITPNDFKKFLSHCGHRYQVVDLGSDK